MKTSAGNSNGLVAKVKGALRALPPLIRDSRHGSKLTMAPVQDIRCIETPFGEVLEFAGKPICDFPPYKFFEFYLPKTPRRVFMNSVLGWRCAKGLDCALLRTLVSHTLTVKSPCSLMMTRFLIQT